MGMTVTEKILAAHAGMEEVKPGQLIEAHCDMTLANDITAPIAIREFSKLNIDKVWDRERITSTSVSLPIAWESSIILRSEKWE
jgi:3-isopropylmalate/(R)-2-methylmalate dehydratase large subunit